MVTSRAEGDLTRDRVVDFADFHQWKGAFLTAGGSLAGFDFSFALNVPEPTGLVLAILSFACGSQLTRRNRPVPH
jgi:hypothetical protein